MQKQPKDETDVTFESVREGFDFAIGAGFHVEFEDKTASRPDQPTRKFKLEQNRVGRWEWKAV